MKTKTKTDLMKVETWLPVFSGFYGTIWETDGDEEMEIDSINERRAEKGLAPVEWDAIEWNYQEHQNNVAKGFTKRIAAELMTLGMIDGITFQELRSPREYNFANDSINVEIELTKKNVIEIDRYLKANKTKFAEYIKDRYTSGPGFLSSYINDVCGWLGNLGATLAHGHMLGSVFNFILLNENSDMERDVQEEMSGNGYTLCATNYATLTEGN